VSDVER